MTQTTRLVHFIPGRLRVKSEQVRGRPATAKAVQRRLKTLEGVCHVEANPVTGSVVVYYDPESQTILRVLGERLGFLPAGRETIRINHGPQSSPREPHPQVWRPLGISMTDFFAGLNTSLAQATGGWGDMRALIPLILVMLGLRSLVVSERLLFPRWYDFFWFAFGTFVALNTTATSSPASHTPRE